jgi:transcriptional regulator with XRE-family HTH domain
VQQPRNLELPGVVADERLTGARKKRGLTQIQLAEKLGCQQPLVAKIENGKRRLDVVESVEVTNAIGCDASTIIKKLLADKPPTPSSSR